MLIVGDTIHVKDGHEADLMAFHAVLLVSLKLLLKQQIKTKHNTIGYICELRKAGHIFPRITKII